MDRIGAAVVSLNACLANYAEIVGRQASPEAVEAAREALSAAMDHFCRSCDEDTDWGDPFDGPGPDPEVGAKTRHPRGGHRLTVDYRIHVERSRTLIQHARAVHEAPDACVPMTVNGVDDALYGLMTDFTWDLATRFREAGARVEFQVRQ